MFRYTCTDDRILKQRMTDRLAEARGYRLLQLAALYNARDRKPASAWHKVRRAIYRLMSWRHRSAHRRQLQLQ